MASPALRPLLGDRAGGKDVEKADPKRKGIVFLEENHGGSTYFSGTRPKMGHESYNLLLEKSRETREWKVGFMWPLDRDRAHEDLSTSIIPSIHRPTHPPTPTNQPTDRPTSQPASQPTIQPTNQATVIILPWYLQACSPERGVCSRPGTVIYPGLRCARWASRPARLGPQWCLLMEGCPIQLAVVVSAWSTLISARLTN